jgi:hypothetical protein
MSRASCDAPAYRHTGGRLWTKEPQRRRCCSLPVHRHASTLALLGDGRPWVCGRGSGVWPVLHLGPPLVDALGRAAWHLEIRQAVKAEWEQISPRNLEAA